ncbi:MAG: hypothetical protein ACOCWQ_00830 [Nanoarchaeota archaeon]
MIVTYRAASRISHINEPAYVSAFNKGLLSFDSFVDMAMKRRIRVVGDSLTSIAWDLDCGPDYSNETYVVYENRDCYDDMFSQFRDMFSMSPYMKAHYSGYKDAMVYEFFLRDDASHIDVLLRKPFTHSFGDQGSKSVLKSWSYRIPDAVAEFVGRLQELPEYFQRRIECLEEQRDISPQEAAKRCSAEGVAVTLEYLPGTQPRRFHLSLRDSVTRTAYYRKEYVQDDLVVPERLLNAIRVDIGDIENVYQILTTEKHRSLEKYLEFLHELFSKEQDAWMTSEKYPSVMLRIEKVSDLAYTLHLKNQKGAEFRFTVTQRLNKQAMTYGADSINDGLSFSHLEGKDYVFPQEATDGSDPEEEKPACSDGKDNDGDGLKDSEDPGCWKDSTDPSSYDRSRESEHNTRCANSLDDGPDGKVDKYDPDCWTDPTDSTTYDRHLDTEDVQSVPVVELAVPPVGVRSGHYAATEDPGHWPPNELLLEEALKAQDAGDAAKRNFHQGVHMAHNDLISFMNHEQIAGDVMAHLEGIQKVMATGLQFGNAKFTLVPLDENRYQIIYWDAAGPQQMPDGRQAQETWEGLLEKRGVWFVHPNLRQVHLYQQ